MLEYINGRQIRIRQLPDGMLMIPKPNKEIEKFMDDKYDRLYGQLIWYPKAQVSSIQETFKNKFRNQTGYIVGKGPSLDYLNDSYVGDGPVIALNNSIHKVEEELSGDIFCVQQDIENREKCLPTTGVLFLSDRCKGWYSSLEEKRKFLFSTSEFGLHNNAYSILIALKILDCMGCEKIKFLCCDAYTEDNYEYAKVIGESSHKYGSPERYKSQVDFIRSQLKGYKYEFIIPQESVEYLSEDDDKSQLQHNSPEEHHELQDSESEISHTDE